MRPIRAQLAVAGMLLVGTILRTPAVAQDSCGTATAVTGLPSTVSQDTTSATSDPSDPALSCGTVSSATVWYTYTASRSTTLLLDTSGSDYQTGIGVYTGGCGAPTEIACGDDDDFDDATQLVVPVAAGQTVHILVGGTASGGNLTLQAAKAPFDATPPVSVQAAVATGSPNPLGGSFVGFSRAVALSKTDLAFTGTTEAIFVHDGSGATTIAVSGDPTPVGGTFVNFGQPAGATGETVAFVSTVTGGAGDSGIFLYAAGAVSALVAQGDPAPGGGTFDNFVGGIAINPSGTTVAFIADTTLDGREALYLYHIGSGVFGPLLREGSDPSPCGGTVTSMGNTNPVMAINDAGVVVLFARSPGNVDGIYQWAGTWTAVACEGAPTPLGGTYRAINRTVRIANFAPLGLFFSTVTLPGPDTQGLFAGSTAGAFVLARQGEVLSGGETIDDFPSVPVVNLTSSGDLVYLADTVPGGDAIVTRSSMATQSTAVLFEGSSPCPAGGAFRAIDPWLSADDATGAIAFAAVCTGGRGIFEMAAGGGPPQAIALQTETTPVGAGFTFDDPTISGSSIAFEGSRGGVFRVSCPTAGCGAVTTVAAPLTAVPGLPGEVLSTIEPEMLAGQGDLIAFGATTTGAARRGAIVASRAGTLAVVAADGLAFPGTTTEPTDVLFTSTPASFAADTRGVAFVTSIVDSGDPVASDGVYLWRGGTVTEMARNDQPAPNGGLYGTFSMPLAKGGRAFVLADTTLGACFVSATSGGETSIACEGDSLPAPPGGTLGFVEADLAGLGSRGPVFRAQVLGGTASECLLAPKGDAVAPVACQGDLLPHGGTAGSFDSLVIGASRRRVVAYTTDDDFAFSALFHFGAQARARIAGPGVATPIGGTYLLSSPLPSVHGKTVVFVSGVDAGTASQAVFSAILRR